MYHMSAYIRRLNKKAAKSLACFSLYKVNKTETSRKSAGLAHGAGVHDRNIVRLHLFRV